MTRWIIALHLEYDNNTIVDLKKLWLSYGIQMIEAKSVEEVLKLIGKNGCCLLIMILSKNGKPVYLPFIEMLKDVCTMPILVLSDNVYEHGCAHAKGVDFFTLMSPNLKEHVNTGWSLIRRYIDLNYRKIFPLTVLTYEDIFMCVDYREVFIGEAEIKLTKIEFEIMHLLLSSPKRVFSYDQISAVVWKDGHEDKLYNSLFNHVSRLRNKIHKTAKNKEYIVNIHDIGYRLISQIKNSQKR